MRLPHQRDSDCSRLSVPSCCANFRPDLLLIDQLKFVFELVGNTLFVLVAAIAAANAT
jgi:hypothetical protein